MRRIDFTFSDLIAGYVTDYAKDQDSFGLKASDGREFTVKISGTAYAELIRNLGEPYHDATGQMRSLITPGRFLYTYGIFYPDGAEESYSFEAKHIVFLGRTENEFAFERQDWWIKQIRQLADFYLSAQFPDGKIDFLTYRTNLNITGQKMKSGRQEADTISRLVYGFASAFMMTGDDRYLEAAEKGTGYLRAHFRARDATAGVSYWYHAVDIKDDGTEQKIFASEFGDDFDAIPCYEQIYALAGPVQTYRITGDPKIISDVDETINLFNRFFKDKTDGGGFYSHIDPITFNPMSESLGHNQGRKNWNSVGDHAPAYLINLYLATGAQEHADFLEYTFDTIAQHFPDYENSPFVQEKFFADWSKDQSWGNQQNRAIVGHNLKIAWNLMRMHSLKPKQEYLDLAEKIAAVMPAVGSDQQRGGWYDMVERMLEPGQSIHRLVWHDRKAWWQQEQAILAYLILHGALGNQIYQKHAREAAAFYNAWFLDVESGGVYFNVLANGLPYSLGTERGKGSHSMSGYHAFELAYLAATYTNLLITKEPMDFYFKPKPGAFAGNLLRVQPDLLPPGSVRISEAWIDNVPYDDFDAEGMTVRLPANHDGIKVQVRLVPASVKFSADLMDVSKGVAKIALAGALDPAGLKYLEEQMEAARDNNATAINFDMSRLTSISSEAVRFMIFQKQKLGGNFAITISGAPATVLEAIQDSEFSDEVTLV
jgi:mannose/cellobiose epimerase-like protein (N-acyl-D-glucosamine 2-epimerase family)